MEVGVEVVGDDVVPGEVAGEVQGVDEDGVLVALGRVAENALDAPGAGFRDAGRDVHELEAEKLAEPRLLLVALRARLQPVEVERVKGGETHDTLVGLFVRALLA